MSTAGQKLNLLSLDGGGIRGLSSLYILKQVMESVNPDCPPKPCEYFDMIAGTSTGGWVAFHQFTTSSQLTLDSEQTDCHHAWSLEDGC